MPAPAALPPEPPEAPSEPQPTATTLTEEDEFLVLPGETLAKHTPQAWEEPESGEPAFPAGQPEETESAEPVAEEAPAEPVAVEATRQRSKGRATWPTSPRHRGS